MSTTPNTRTDTEAWLEGLGCMFVEVRLYVREDSQMVWVDERHVDDPETLVTTICMSLERLRGRFAVWPSVGAYSLCDASKRSVKSYPTQEAAEMVAIHHAS